MQGYLPRKHGESAHLSASVVRSHEAGARIYMVINEIQQSPTTAEGLLWGAIDPPSSSLPTWQRRHSSNSNSDESPKSPSLMRRLARFSKEATGIRSPSSLLRDESASSQRSASPQSSVPATDSFASMRRRMRFSRDSYCHDEFQRNMKASDDASPIGTPTIHGTVYFSSGSEQHPSLISDSVRKLRLSQLDDEEIVQVLTPPMQRPCGIIFCRRSSRVNVGVRRADERS